MDKSALRKQFKLLLNRNDCSETLADTFIDQAVGRIQRTLRIPSMEKAATIIFSEALPDSFVLPNDFLDFIDIYFDEVDGGAKLERVPRGAFLGTPRTGGRPRVYIRTGAGVQVRPLPALGTQIELLYYAEVPDLITDTDSNVFSDIAPDLVIYGALSFAGDHFVDERKPSWEDTYIRIYGEIVEQARELEFSGSDAAVQSIYPTQEY
jgi:hypothetical protein